MGHSYNHGLVTSMKGAAIEAVRIVGMDDATPSVDEGCGAGLVDSVALAAGVVTVQLAAPYPPKLIVCIPSYSAAAATTDIITARYVTDSYDETAGTFQIALSNDDDAGAPIAASPGATDELHLLLVFGRYNGIPSN